MVSGDGEELPTALLDTGPGDPVHEAAEERTLTAASACGSVPDHSGAIERKWLSEKQSKGHFSSEVALWQQYSVSLI